MAAPQRQSNDAQRPPSIRSTQPVTHEVIDDDDDLYVADYIGVSDGFRPPQLAYDDNTREAISSQPPRWPTPPAPQPSSTTKPDNLALRHDGVMGPVSASSALSTDVPNASSEAPSLSRTTSLTSDGPIITADEPYVGPTRPSHAYNMSSPGRGLQRTASSATTSTFNMPAERRYSGPSGPTHPYAMYPQNTVPVEPEVIVNANIPLGFNDVAGRQYQRRIGPDGEDAGDLIGPDGHTEALPPYSKYPDEAFARKSGRLPTPPPPPTPVPETTRDSADDGAGGIGLATRNPEFGSNEELANRPASIPSRHSTEPVSVLSSHSAAHVAPPLKEEMSEKPPEKQDGKWRERLNGKACGIVPVWALCLAVVVVLIVALLLGIVLGITFDRKDKERYARARASAIPTTGKYHTTFTTTVDATPMASVPTNLAELPLGNYSIVIPPSMPFTSLCIVDKVHLASWSCAMPAVSLHLSISSIPHAKNTTNKRIHLRYPNDGLNTWAYGTQPPDIDETKVLNLVRDYDDPDYGPAWFFQVPYAKLVVLNENTFAGLFDGNPESDFTEEQLEANQKRDPDRRRKGVAQAGDKPWFCYWNGTLLEGFIYPNTTSDAGDVQMAASLSAEAAEATATTSSYGPARRHAFAPRGAEWLKTELRVAATATSGFEVKVREVEPKETILSQRPRYPKVVKLEERRMPRMDGYDQPYCVQMEIGADGVSKSAVLDEYDIPRVIRVSERSSDALRKRGVRWKDGGVVSEGAHTPDEVAKSLEHVGYLRERRDLPDECHCIWMVE